MLKNLRVENFRRFDRFSVSFKEGNILSGPNNSGKSSLIDAIRIIAACQRSTKRTIPSSIQLEDGRVVDGYVIPEHRIPVSLVNCIHNYNDDDAVIEITMQNGAKATVLLNRIRQIRFFVEHDGKRLNSVSRMNSAFNWQCGIVPTLGALEQDERFVSDETILKRETTRVSGRHLRNVWFRKSDAEFLKFADDVARSWKGIEIKKPERNQGDPSYIEMYFSENRLDREVFWSGYGFQIWLQVLTHLNRISTNQTLVIDEPDVYLHPEVQKMLMRIIRERYKQYIVTTHSVEIINDAEAMEIVSVDPDRKSAKRIRSEDDYSQLYNYIGSSQNAELARVAKARKVIFVEGKDRRLISVFASRLGCVMLYEGSVPFVELGGFGGWQKAKHAVWALKEILDLEVSVCCLFDRDYRCIEEIEGFESKLLESGIRCFVLRRKEIENYLLDLRAICRAVAKRAAERGACAPTISEIESWLLDITSEMKDRVFANIKESLASYVKRERIDKLVSNEIDIIESGWHNVSCRIDVCPGKEVLQRINEKIQSIGLGALTPKMIVNEIDVSSIDTKFVQILNSLDEFCR